VNACASNDEEYFSPRILSSLDESNLPRHTQYPPPSLERSQSVPVTGAPVHLESTQEMEYADISEHYPAVFKLAPRKSMITKLDTACYQNYMGYSDFKQLTKEKLIKNLQKRKAELAGSRYEVLGSITLDWHLKDNTAQEITSSFDILKDFTHPILIGLPTINKNGLLKSSRPMNRVGFPAGTGKRSGRLNYWLHF